MTRLISIILVILISCVDRKRTENSVYDNKKFHRVLKDSIPLRHKFLFKLDHQDSFSFAYRQIDSLLLIRMDSIQFAQLLQTDDLVKYNTSEFEHYFYSYQESKEKYEMVTMVIATEYENSIYCLTYDHDGVLLSKFKVAGSGGDGRFSNNEYGWFLNDSTYVRNTIQREFYQGGDSAKVDSTQTWVVINSHGKLTHH